MVLCIRLGSRSWRVWVYHSSLFVLSSSLTSPGGIGAESDSESILTLGANDSMACSFTSVRWNNRKHYECTGRRPYLAIVENNAERSRDRFKRTEGTSGVSHPTKQFGRGRRSTLVVRFLLIRSGAWFEGGLVGKNNFRSIIREGRGLYIPEGTIRDSNQNCHAHVLSDFPPYEIEGVGGDG